MGQVISRVYELIELAQQKKISTRFSDQGVAELSAMLIDVGNFSRQEFERPFSDLMCEEVDRAFLESYKEYLLEKKSGSAECVPVKEHLLSMHSIFNFVDAYNIANMNIDMFELFLIRSKEEGVL